MDCFIKNCRVILNEPNKRFFSLYYNTLTDVNASLYKIKDQANQNTMNVYKYWQDIEGIIDEALELEEEAQELFIKKSCSHNPDLLIEALDYYSFIKKAEDCNFLNPDFNLESDLISGPEYSADKQIRENVIGITIGPYKITEPIGEGGMGSVYLAERIDGEFDQKVAIKFLRGGFFSSYLRKRFINEKRILARLNHPNITRLLDGGITDDGTPYLTMEYVDGLPVDEYCKKKKLDVTARLKLFLQICKAVQFAHTKLVIHRDLKPQNILVTKEGQIKIMDFGIAKFLNPDAEKMLPLKTREGQFVASFKFAAPEQIRSEDPSIATDVYGLGALLYLLVTGEHPLQFDDHSISEIKSIIQNKAPVRPGRIEKNEIGPISRDLEAIILKTLNKEPEQRYSSVELMRDDIERYLNGLPVNARHSTFVYRSLKFIQRNRIALTVTFLLVLGIFSLLTYHNNQLAKERDIAHQEAEKAEQISSFFVNLFEMADPEINQGEAPTAAEMLDQGIARIDGLSGQPELQIELLQTAGNIYLTIMELERAEQILTRSYELARNTFDNENEVILHHLALFGTLQRLQGNFEEARSYNLRALDIQKNIFDESHPDIACIYSNLGLIEREQNNYTEAEEYYSKAISQHNYFEEDHHCFATVYNNMGTLKRHIGEYESSEAYYLKALEMRRNVLDYNHPHTANTLNNLSILKQNTGQYDSALQFLHEALQINKTILGNNHPAVAANLNSLGNLYWYRDDHEQASIHISDALDILKTHYDHNNTDIAISKLNLGLNLLELNQLDEAERLIKESVSIFRNQLGDRHLHYAHALYNLASVLQKKDDHNQAFSALEKCLDIRKEKLPHGHWHIALAKSSIGYSLSELGENHEAEYYLEQGYEVLSNKRGDDDTFTQTARERLDAFHNKQ